MNKNDLETYRSVINLPFRLFCFSECSNLCIPINTGKHEGYIQFPIIEDNYGDVIFRFEDPIKVLESKNSSKYWEKGLYEIKEILMKINGDNSPNIQNISTFFFEIQKLLEIRTHAYLGNIPNLSNRFSQKWYSSHGGEYKLIQANSTSPIKLDRCPSKAVIQEVFKLVNSNFKIPLPYEFLRFAIKEETFLNRRNAIMDIATSIETALTQKCQQLLIEHKTPESTIQLMLDQFPSMLRKHDLYKKLGGKLSINKNKLDKTVQRLRNRAIHAGKTPEKEEVWEAINIAYDILEDLIPEFPSTKSEQ